MKVLMVGGGTGGHIYPAIAIAEAIQDRMLDSQVLFVGSEGGIEEKIVPEARFSLVTIKARGMLRKLSFKAVTAPFYAVAGFFDSLKVIKAFKPDIIVASGGFVSLPVVLAGSFRRVPIVLHEGNLIPGLTTRICKWFATAVNIEFESQRKYFKWKKVHCVGGPVRKNIIQAVKSIAIQKMGLRQDQKILLVLGGSQGAMSINKVVIEALPELAKMNIQVIHVCGERDHSWIKDAVKEEYPFYHLISYMYNVWDGLAACDLVVSRAGATAISEIIARGLPSILIPFPFSAEGHQEKNARLIKDSGAAVIINDQALDKETLIRNIEKIMKDRELHAKMSSASALLGRPKAANDFVDIIANIMGIELYVKKRKKRAGK
jgi:UDP-N-acetylglucosamine--N-acetylmuramyl-(pentapeptide) pyrophosphoryl-undecaprenol N-acetylglucosamine transferase